MNLSRDRQAIELLEQALELPRDQVAKFLRESCGSDSALREKIESMLAVMKQSDGFLSTHLVQTLDTTNGIVGDVRLHAGTILADRYLIDKAIGVGGMGEVYRATDQRLDRSVAVKTLSTAGLQSDEMRNRFDREVKSVAALAHPNVMTLYDIIDDGNAQFAVMELVEGETLRRRISDGLDWQVAVRIAEGIASGLGAAHERDVMHRDIKPENIIVTVSGNAKILDFGLARLESLSDDQQLTVSSVTPGTVPYMSPEQAEGGRLQCSTDIFSFGTVLFEMLTGTNPFRGENIPQTMRLVSDANPPSISELVENLPDQLKSLVAAMLARSPSDRPSAPHIARELRRLISQSPVTTRIENTQAPSTIPQSSRNAKWQPSLIVRPFQCFVADDELKSVAGSLVENLTTILTRMPMLSVISRSSGIAMQDVSLTAAEARGSLGVDYMIEGSLQRFENHVRANVQLIETHSGSHFWAQQFDCDSDASLVTNLLDRIVPVLEPQLVRAMFNDLRDESGELSSRQLLVRAMSVLSLKGWHVDSFNEVAELLHKSIALEPDLALTHAYLALIRGLGNRVGLAADPETAVREAIEHAEQAMDLDGMDSNVLGLSGCALADVGRTARAIPLLMNAIEINPNNAQAHAALGAAHLADGNIESAIQHLATGIDLSPFDRRRAVWCSLLATAYIQQSEIEKALDIAQSGCQADRNSYLPRVVLTAALVAQGESEKAADALNECLRVKPDLSANEITRLVGRNLGAEICELAKAIDARDLI